MEIAQRKVNINGFLQTKLQRNGKLNLVRMVVGVTVFETSRDLQVIREVLNRLGVAFTERKILQVYGFPPNVPGIINTLFGALWCKAGVQTMFLKEQQRLSVAPFIGKNELHYNGMRLFRASINCNDRQ